MTRRRVFIQQNCVPHYRTPLFELLSSDSHALFTIFADEHADAPYLAVATPDSASIRWHKAPVHTVSLPGKVRLFWQPKIVIQMLRVRPDVVIAQGSPYLLTAWALLVLGRLLRVPVLLWTHGLRGTEAGPKWWLRKVLYRLATGLLLYGDHAKTLLIARGFGCDRLHVLYNSLDTELQMKVAAQLTPIDLQGFRRKLGVGDQDRLVVFTGRLQPIKQLPLLFNAVADIRERGKSVHIVLIGDGVEKRALQMLSQRLGISDLVHFLGALYDERDLGLALSASDVAVIPSGAGLSVMHALAYGTPVVLHDRISEHFPEWEAVQDRVTGFFYRYGDVGDLARTMESALFPVSKKPQMEADCRAVIEQRYNPQRQAGAMREAIQQSLVQWSGYDLEDQPSACKDGVHTGPTELEGDRRR